jgi:predicted amidohydrolase YtcJ
VLSTSVAGCVDTSPTENASAVDDAPGSGPLDVVSRRTDSATALAVAAIDRGTQMVARAEDEQPLVLYNGKVYTAAEKASDRWAEAVAVQENKIVKVGTNEKVLQYAGDNARRIDVGGRLVIPGLNDAHVHLLSVSSVAEPLNSPYEFIPGPGPTVEQVLALLTDAVNEYPDGTWLYASVGEAFILSPDANRFTLDDVTPDHPVVLQNWAGHNLYVNSLAMSLASVAEDEPDPFGGFYGRVPETDRLNGVLYEYAEYDFIQRLRLNQSHAQLLSQFEASFIALKQLGVTSVQNMSWLPWNSLEEMFEGYDLPMRLRVICFPVSPEEAQTGCQPGPSLTNQNHKAMFTGVKWILDGTPIERLAALEEPYSDAPGEYGYLTFPEDTFGEAMENAINSGSLRTTQRLFHALGDRPVRALLDGMSAVGSNGKWAPRRLRIEHGDMIQPDQISELVDKGIIVVQNPTHFALPEIYMSRFGPERVAIVQPLRSLIDAGVPVALGSDAIGVGGNPFVDMMFAVLHPTNPDEAITIEEAILAYTRVSAYAEFMEGKKGTIENGKLADIAVLSQDLFSIHPTYYPATYSLLTVTDGEIVWNSGELVIEE